MIVEIQLGQVLVGCQLTFVVVLIVALVVVYLAFIRRLMMRFIVDRLNKRRLRVLEQMRIAELNENKREYELQVQIKQVEISTGVSFVFIFGFVATVAWGIFVLLFAYEMIIDFV